MYYKYVINNADIFRYFYNSMFVAIATTVGQVIISAMAGYAFARFEFKYKCCNYPLPFIRLCTTHK